MEMNNNMKIMLLGNSLIEEQLSPVTLKSYSKPWILSGMD